MKKIPSIIALVGGDGTSVSAAYDSATGRIASMDVWEGRAPSRPPSPFRWTYLPGSDLKESLAYPNGDVVRWEYEPNRDLVTLVSNGVHSSFRYAYDAAGRRIAKNDEQYQYNPRGELVLSTNVVTGAEFAYRYDDIGNRLWSRELGTNCTYVANELNQYTDIVCGGVAEFPAFDLDCNQTNVVTSTGEWAVEYNGENRPIRWTRNSDGTVVTMSYDRMGRRVTKGGERFVYADKALDCVYYNYRHYSQRHGICGKEKGDCDEAFRNDMNAVCDSVPVKITTWCYRSRRHASLSGQSYRYRCTKYPRSDCQQWVSIYHLAVDYLGRSAFDAAQKESGCCPSKGN